MQGVPISKMFAQEAMKNILDSERPSGLTMERIARTVAAHYKMTVEELKSKNNSAQHRGAASGGYVSVQKAHPHSFPEIGREFGGKHHTTVMHSVDKIGALDKDDRDFHKEIKELIDSLCS